MPKVREILGNVKLEVADGSRKCHRNAGHSIRKGEACLAIYDNASVVRGRKNYCRLCAKPILDLAQASIQCLIKALAEDGGQA
jgi:hypothetical protein